MYLWVGQGGGAKGKRGEKRGSSITCARTQQEHPYVRENCKWNLLWFAFSLFTLASYDYDPILQTKAKVKETKQTVWVFP